MPCECPKSLRCMENYSVRKIINAQRGGNVIVYIADFAKRLIAKNNTGILIYLIMNVLLVAFIFSSGFTDTSGIIMGILAYAVSLGIALSPAGEWILRLQTGCRSIKRKDQAERLGPLFSEVLAKAKRIDPSIPDDIKLFICNDKEPNAFATGRKTICLTKGFLDYSDEQIKAVLAHEVGHLAHKDTDLILVITVGNLIVTTIFIITRIVFWLTTIIFTTINNNIGAVIGGLLIDVLFVACMWLWTKLGTVLVMHSSRRNEYLADEFASNCGYGQSLALALDNMGGGNSKGLWASLAASHPNTDDRIARLQ